VVAARVLAARQLSIERQGCLNSALAASRLDEVACFAGGASEVLRRELEHDRLSARGYHRIRRVARTIADLRGHGDPCVDEHDVVLALRFRAALAHSLPNGRAA